MVFRVTITLKIPDLDQMSLIPHAFPKRSETRMQNHVVDSTLDDRTLGESNAKQCLQDGVRESLDDLMVNICLRLPQTYLSTYLGGGKKVVLL